MKNDTLNKDLYPLLNIVKFVLANFIIAVHTWFLIDYKIGYYLYNDSQRISDMRKLDLMYRKKTKLLLLCNSMKEVYIKRYLH